MTSNFNNKLIELLKKDLRFVDEDNDSLIRNEIINFALKADKDLIGLLIKDDEVRNHFFDKIEEYYVFNINKFIDYVEDKNFLSNSYTKFKNQIGLNIDGKYLRERGEVSLVWPFKDCVLEGGMDKEDQKKDEIFFNQTLAKDEIDKLFDAKALTNFKKFTAKGEEKVKDFNRDEKTGVIKDNLIIKGNNLLALHSLKKEFAGKVKLICIDPPYNTQNDGFKYNDAFNRSTWLTFMKNRLEIARELLSDDGSIYVQIDTKESHYLKVLIDEVFGKNNFRSQIIWDTSIPYVAGNKWLSNNWIYSQSTIFYYAKQKETVFFNKQTFEVKQPSGDISNKPLKDVWTDIKNFSGFLGTKDIKLKFNTRKPEHLIERILTSSSNKGDIVLDYHLGSGTTCAVAHKMERQYIGVEQMDYIEEVAIERLKSVIGKETSKGKLSSSIEEYDALGISKAVNWKGGGEFIYCELKKYNEEALDKIQDAKDTKSLLKIWDEMVNYYFLNYDVEIHKFNKNKADFEKLSLAEQKKLLCEMLNKNQLYVNFSEIDDKQFNISKEDKELNSKFYGGN
jgi:adenine-specific DNA-methyltransferase